MAHREKLHALVVKRRDLGEADRILTLFTREQGLLRVVAKGVRRIPSRRGGHLEPFSHLVVVLSGRGESRWLASAETVSDHAALQHSSAFEHADFLRQMLTILTPNEAHARLFDAVRDSWEILPKLAISKRSVLEVAVTMQILHAAGLLPDLSACAKCGASQPDETIILEAPVGGWSCLTCHGSWQGSDFSVTPKSLKALRWLTQNPAAALRLAAEAEESEQLVSASRHYAWGIKNNLQPSYV